MTLLAKLTPLRTDDAPSIGVPAADARDAVWVRPGALVAGWSTASSRRAASSAAPVAGPPR